ncbi:MAG TPA: Uma2 family endonuclease [Longimicrobiaceae bacterium]|nr:Uma2 family endonuclease [Longimicrobiaceae bacterium]
MATDEAVAGGWTYQRYLELDDDTRYEIIDGELLVTPAPSARHQEVSIRLELRLGTFVMERNVGKMYHAPIDVVLGEGEEHIVQPDILYISNEHLGIVGHQAIRGAPDLVMEIVSPTSLRRDRWQKRALYARFGIPEYWIVDPPNRAIEVLSLEEGGYELSSFAAESGTVASRVLDGFEVPVEEVMQD